MQHVNQEDNIGDEVEYTALDNTGFTYIGVIRWQHVYGPALWLLHPVKIISKVGPVLWGVFKRLSSISFNVQGITFDENLTC